MVKAFESRTLSRGDSVKVAPQKSVAKAQSKQPLAIVAAIQAHSVATDPDPTKTEGV